MDKLVPIDTIHGVNTVLLHKVHFPRNPGEYLGPNGEYLYETRQRYERKRDEFLEKARRYYNDNRRLLYGLSQREVTGFEPDDELVEAVLKERELDLEEYYKSMDFMKLSANQEKMYKNFEGREMRIRMVREIGEEPISEFTENIRNEREAWFTRYWILSRFIQAVRTVIHIQRLEKRLEILRKLTREDIYLIESEMEAEHNPKQAEEDGTETNII